MFKLHKLLVAIPDKWKSEVKKKNVCLNEKKSCTILNVKNNLKHIGILTTKEIYNVIYSSRRTILYKILGKTKFNWKLWLEFNFLFQN